MTHFPSSVTALPREAHFSTCLFFDIAGVKPTPWTVTFACDYAFRLSCEGEKRIVKISSFSGARKALGVGFVLILQMILSHAICICGSINSKFSIDM